MIVALPQLGFEETLEMIIALSPSRVERFISSLQLSQHALLVLAKSARHPNFIDLLQDAVSEIQVSTSDFEKLESSLQRRL